MQEDRQIDGRRSPIHQGVGAEFLPHHPRAAPNLGQQLVEKSADMLNSALTLPNYLVN